MTKSDAPLVSICLPNLNTRPFLADRLDCILAQTYQHWELIVSDNFSDDGAWEYFTERAASDRRIKIAQREREGMYPNWNACVDRARGEYVYIATSDDTMAEDCLEKLVAALESQPACDLALCPLKAIDESGRSLSEPSWPTCTAFTRDLGELAGRPHIHHAPYDGMLHLLGQIVYNSITQLLIRRSLFTKVGGFSGRWGSVGDFHWEMKASLVANTVLVPDTWASWRVHASQATAQAKLMTRDHFAKVHEMTEDAFISVQSQLDPRLAEGLRSCWLNQARELRDYYAALRERRWFARRIFQLSRLLRGGPATRRRLLQDAISQTSWWSAAPKEFRAWLASLGLPAISELKSRTNAPTSESVFTVRG